MKVYQVVYIYGSYVNNNNQNCYSISRSKLHLHREDAEAELRRMINPETVEEFKEDAYVFGYYMLRNGFNETKAFEDYRIEHPTGKGFSGIVIELEVQPLNIKL